MKAELVDQVNRFEQEKRGLKQTFDQQLQRTVSQLRDQLDQKVFEEDLVSMLNDLF